MYPSYLSLKPSEWESKEQLAKELLHSCKLCGHKCKIDRENGKIGICKMGSEIKLASASVHKGEEPCFSGISNNYLYEMDFEAIENSGGTGNLFFSSCTAKCVFCQNYPISQLKVGNTVTPEQVANYMLELQEKGVYHIGWVTPTPHIPKLITALKLAREGGLHLAIIANTNSYLSMEALHLLDGLIDIYLPDFKYASNSIALDLSFLENYRDVTLKSILEMYRQVGRLQLQAGIAYKGVLIRHLVLPNNLSQTEDVLHIISSTIDKQCAISLMSQYFPTYKSYDFPLLNRKLTATEYKNALDKMEKYLDLWGFKQKCALDL